jgi:predicted acyltransferase
MMLLTRLAFNEHLFLVGSFFLFGLCWTIPTASAFIVGILKKVRWKKEPESTHLFLLLLGAGLFGVIDHIWNGEIFLIGENIFKDIALGIVITIATFVVWGLLVFFARKKKTAEETSSK